MESLLGLLGHIKHTHMHINPSLPLPSPWLAKRVLFPALISCQFVILRPGHISFHRVWVYWLHSGVYVVIEISLDGQGYGRGIRRGQQPRGVGMAKMLGCLEPSPRKIKAGSRQQQTSATRPSWGTGAWTWLWAVQFPLHPSTLPPSFQSSRCPPVPKILPRAMKAGPGGLRLSLSLLQFVVSFRRLLAVWQSWIIIQYFLLKYLTLLLVFVTRGI